MASRSHSMGHKIERLNDEWVYEHDHSIHIHNAKNDEGEKVIIPIQKISYIKYIQNKGCMGSKKDPKVYDWDKDFK